MSKVVALIPARMGSQRLPKKNLREVCGVPLITRAIRKCKEADCFDEIWVNSEHPAFSEIASSEGVFFHHRPTELGDNETTSEQFVHEFLSATQCETVFQVHSITPLLTSAEVRLFVETFLQSNYDVMLSCIHDQIEVAYKNCPVNFTLDQKQNSQELDPVQRITWSITGWRSKAFLEAYGAGACATYSGVVGYQQVSAASGHAIKTELDLAIAEALMSALKLS